jgi:hypothetical protein
MLTRLLFTPTLFLLLLLFLLAPLAASSPQTLTLHITSPTTSAKPSIYGTISYNPKTLQASFTSAPSSKLPPNPLAKLGVYDSATRRWRNAVVAHTDALRRGVCVVLYLAEDDGAEVRLVGLAEEAAEGGACVRVVRAVKGPEPVLNRPVVLGEDGKVPEPEVERSFLQK